MTKDRTLAMAAGAMYLLTFVTSIPALALKQPFLGGAGSAAATQWAVLLELVLAFACIGTAVAIYPVARRKNEALALGFVASRTLEASVIFTGVVSLLSLVSMRSAGVIEGGAGPETLRVLTHLHDWAFLIGPGLMPVVNAVLLGTLLHRYRLVPRIIPLIGLIGAPLLLTSTLGTLFGVIDQVSPIAGAMALPIALWEFSIGVWLMIKGFNTTPLADSTPDEAPHSSAH